MPKYLIKGAGTGISGYFKQKPSINGFVAFDPQPRGFTLIEILIAVSIIAIISAVGIISYSQAQLLGRDAKRKQDLRGIATGLELYYQKNKHYPCTGASWQYSSTTPGFWITNSIVPTGCGDATHVFNQNYINMLPVDPRQNSGQSPFRGNSGYAFWSGTDGANCSADGQYYVLTTLLENTNDPDSLKNKNYYYYCGGINFNSASMSGGAWNDRSFIITSQ